MRIPLTKYGLPQVVMIPAIILAVMLLCLFAGFHLAVKWPVLIIESILFVLLIFVLSFFRDPERTAPNDAAALLAPADGRIMDIETVEGNSFIEGKAVRIGIFLSIFNTHINRSPCRVKVEKIEYKKGKFKDARNPAAGKVNESNDLFLVRRNEPADKLIVRQISGAIARRIVCEAAEGDELDAGEKFGMIKFGSRTELYIPMRENIQCMTKVGDKVKAGLTVLARYT
ncbi:MAG: phosphatidylserine decarboxylase family protein [Sedimentisphaerales bacterium]|nr:phosphatidylserine decarboxylase family protein [Sedimentisphaerales bacterium]